MATPKYEYDWVETDAIGQSDGPSCEQPTIELEANRLGKLGWELVAVVARPQLGKPGYRHWFKRQLPADGQS